MSTTAVILGFHGGFLLTFGFGDSSIEPPPTPPSATEQGAILGGFIGGMTDSTVHATLGMEFY